MAEGKGDRWEGMQMSVMPKIDSELKGFQLEMLFEYPNEIGGGTYLDWAHGVVTEVISTKTTHKFRVKWAEECVGDLDQDITVEKVFVSKWNPKKPVARAWREFEPTRE